MTGETGEWQNLLHVLESLLCQVSREGGEAGRGKTWRLGQFVEDGGVRGNIQSQAPADGLESRQETE